MESFNFPSKLEEKLIAILIKLTDSYLQKADEVFFEKLLSAIRKEFDESQCYDFKSLIDWLSKLMEHWIDNPPPTTVFTFVLQLIGILSSQEKTFYTIQNSNLFHVQIHNLKVHIYKNANLKHNYISLLSSVVNHKLGCEWMKDTKLWREVIDVYLTNSGLFIGREALSLLTKFLDQLEWDKMLFNEIMESLLVPLDYFSCNLQKLQSNEKSSEWFQKKLEFILMPVLQAFITLLEGCIVSVHHQSSFSLVQSFDIQDFWKFLLESCEKDNVLEKLSIAYVLQSLCRSGLENMIQMKEVPDSIFEVFKVLISRKKILVVMKLAKYCQILWNKISSSCKHCANNEVEKHFIIIQLIPAILVIKKSKQTDSFVEIYLNKLFDLSTEKTKILASSMKDIIKSYGFDSSFDYALQAVLSVSENVEILNLKSAALIFQALANVLKLFIPRGCNFDDPMSDEQYEKARMLCCTKATLLSLILNTICMIVEKFKIDWTEALESLCLLKFSATLLNNPNLPPRIGIQTLALIKLAIINFMSPNLVLLLDKIEGTSLQCLLPLLYNKLHDPNWGIRDSCVEVIGIIAELADKKYPLFQEIIIQGNYCEVLVSMIDGDSESYVRSSALKSLSQMIRIERIRNECLDIVQILSKISLILTNESEGIVRREAALLAKEVLDCQSIRPDLITDLYRIMSYAAVCDLYWEVKVNSLFFWEKVIQRFLADQGMIDGSFPSITFSKDKKKIVSLTNELIKTKLNKVLEELSNTGCLYVLLTTLKEDCDFQVVQKSAQIALDLLEILNRYDFPGEHLFSGSQSFNHKSVKRKSSYNDCSEKKSNQSGLLCGEGGHPNFEPNKSNKIIEDIVNEVDLNLLGNVYNPIKEVSVEKIQNFSLKRLEPDLFLNEIQTINIKNFLNAKRQWLFYREDNLDELLNDFLTLSVESENNILDCY